MTNVLFGTVKLTKNANIDKHKYLVMELDLMEKDIIPGRNVIIFGVNMDSSPNLDNKEKDIIILGKGPTQGLGEHSLSGEKMYSINFTKVNTKFCLSLHYNGDNSYLFVNGTEIHKFKAKDSMIVPNNLYLGNVTKDFSTSKKANKQDLMVTFTILVLVMIVLMLIILKTFTSI